MNIKPYDIFVSYSHKQRQLVMELARRLRAGRVRVWFDDWEMQPGDFLRERISKGIEESRYFLVVVSRDALTSNLVKYELNCGIVAEIEQNGVNVIPALAPQMEYELLPVDLRAKSYLDLRTTEGTEESTRRLIKLLNPYRYRLMEETAAAKVAVREGPQTPTVLREYLFGRGPHNPYIGPSVELAAITQLERLKGTASVLVLAERALQLQHIRVIERSLTALYRCADDGGLLVLASTWSFDSRMTYLKERLIGKVLSRAGLTHQFESLKASRSIQESLDKLRSTQIEDLANGAILCQKHDRSYDNRGDCLDMPGPKESAAAENYAQRRLPGLVELLRVSKFGHF
jgi:hypothetical protein